MAKVNCTLTDPFPTERLASLNLGNMDGHRDEIIEKVFIKTASINTFMSDKHSIIVGSFGIGKSALFNLLKNKSSLLGDTYGNNLIVAIEEQVRFDQVRESSESIFPNLTDKLRYQLIWKFQICVRVCEEIAALENFGKTKDEKFINEFLNRVGGRGGYLSVMDRLKSIFDKISGSVKISAKLSDVPVDVELKNEKSKVTDKIEVNLDRVIEKISSCLASRNFKKATIIIDKLDKFVSGEDYRTQRSYIEALLQLEDDLHQNKQLGFKIFIRSDLYDRLNFSSLGPDKAEDNTLRLQWTRQEIRSFIATRLYVALHEEGLWHYKEIFNSSDLSDYSMKWYEKILFDKNNKSGIMYWLANKYRNIFGRKTTQKTLFEKLDLLVIEKLFCFSIDHECPDGKSKQINIKDFFDTHFLDGNHSCTPRYMLVFLKEILSISASYYLNSPNIKVSPILSGGDWVYNLFNAQLTYKAYISAKEKYIRHACKIDDKWSGLMMELLSKKGQKKSFDFKWIKSTISFDSSLKDEQAINFLTYLSFIGFLKQTSYDVDIRKRQFELPILYKKELGCIKFD